MGLRDASEYILPGVVASLDALDDLEPQDEAMCKIARHLARVVDQASPAKQAYVAHWVIPELVRVLAELGCSPASRARIRGGAKPVELDSPLKRLRPVGL